MRPSVCPEGHSYPLVDGTPVMLFETDRDYDHYWIKESVDLARGLASAPPPPEPPADRHPVDPFVHEPLVSACGEPLLLRRRMG